MKFFEEKYRTLLEMLILNPGDDFGKCARFGLDDPALPSSRV